MSRHKNEQNRKRSKLKKIVAILFVVFIAISGYIVYQYYEGIKIAGESELPKNDVEDFNGAPKLEKVNVLLLGVDSRGEEKSRTDTIMVAQFDPKTDEAKLISIMRDTYVEIPSYNNYKINTAYFLGGVELLRQTIKDNFDIDLNYYAVIDFKGFEKVVDTLAPNGIEMNVEKRMSEKIGVVLEPGLQNLNGKELLGYARFRQDAEGDFGRVERQQEVINALKDEMISVSGIAKLPKLVGTIQPNIATNLEGLERLDFLIDLIINPPAKIETLRIPIENSFTNKTYDHAGAVLEIDFEQNQQAIDVFLNN